MITWILLSLQLIFIVVGMFVAKTKNQKRINLAATYGLLIIWLFEYGYHDFIKFNVLVLLLSIMIAYLTYLVSLIIVGTKLSKDNLMPIGCFQIPDKPKKFFVNESLRNILSSTYEELFYRWLFFNAIHEITNMWLVATILTISLFFAVHLKKKKALIQKIDILVFSIIITLIFYFTANPIYCIVIHIIRNQLIICQKYVAADKHNKKMEQYLRKLKGRTSK